MDSSQRRSSIPIPKRKSSFQMYLSDDKSLESDSNSMVSSSTITPPSIMHTSFTSPQIISNDYLKLKETHNQLINKFEETSKKNQNLECTNLLLKKSLIVLQEDVARYKLDQSEYKEILETNRKLKKKIVEIIPNSLEEDDNKASSEKRSEIDNLMNEMEKLKSYLNNVELQLYEANEKISELQETKHEIEQNNEKLRTENAELSNVARLMSVNMLESIDTSKRMNESLVRMKKERDSLVKSSRDSIDSKTTVNEEILRMKTEMDMKQRTYEAQFIEYKKLMEEELTKNSNEQIECLQVRVDLLEKDLEAALKRAEDAEQELQEMKQCQQVTCLDSSRNENEAKEMSTAPPPPAPPPPPFSLFNPKSQIINTNTHSRFSDAISTRKLNQIQNTVHNKQENKATGLDSVIADIKSGRVTLRRRRNNLTYSSINNPALKEMYEIIEKTKQQNRTSKVLVECQLFTFGSNTDSNISDEINI